MGSAAISDDFTAVKDLIDMTHDIVPGSFVPGLPDQRELPGVVPDANLMTELIARVLAWKDNVDQGTDRWALFPIPEDPVFGGRIPVIGLGTPTVYDYTLLGAAKYGHFNSLTARNANVDTIFRYMGTDMPIGAEVATAPATPLDTRLVFGSKNTVDECLLRDGSAAVYTLYKCIDWDIANSIREMLLKDGIWTNHLWFKAMPALREDWTANVWSRFVDEAGFAYIFWPEHQDLGQNYGTLWAQHLGIPYIRG